jgi:hypothetical protein
MESKLDEHQRQLATVGVIPLSATGDTPRHSLDLRLALNAAQ